MKETEIFKISKVLSKYIDGLEENELENAIVMRDVWKDVLFSIRGPKHNLAGKAVYLGEKLYSHTKIIDLVNEVLLVEVDHSGWIQTLQFYNSYILRGLNQKIPNLKISNIAFRLKGSDFNIKPQAAHPQAEETIKKDEPFVELKIRDDLPEELKAKFLNLKNIMNKK